MMCYIFREGRCVDCHNGEGSQEEARKALRSAPHELFKLLACASGLVHRLDWFEGKKAREVARWRLARVPADFRKHHDILRTPAKVLGARYREYWREFFETHPITHL